MKKTFYAIAFLLGLCIRTASAQDAKPTFYAFVDTANVVAVAPDIYITWIYAASVPHPTPMVSSAVLVAFDCKNHKVARQYHIVYSLNKDSTGVIGPIVEDSGTWVDVSVPQTYDLVCSVGATRPYTPPAEPEVPKQGPDVPEPDPNSMFPVS